MLAIAPGQPTLTSDRLVLRPLVEHDAAAVAAGAGDPQVARYLIDVPTPYPVALARRWIRSRVSWWREGKGVTLAIALRDQPGALLGTVSLRRYARDRRAELGYWLASAAWQRGYASEATRRVVDYGFTELRLVRIYAQVIAGNVASERVLSKLGMVCEGVKRQHLRKDRRRHDLVFYGLLAEEWRR